MGDDRSPETKLALISREIKAWDRQRENDSSRFKAIEERAADAAGLEQARGVTLDHMTTHITEIRSEMKKFFWYILATLVTSVGALLSFAAYFLSK